MNNSKKVTSLGVVLVLVLVLVISSFAQTELDATPIYDSTYNHDTISLMKVVGPVVKVNDGDFTPPKYKKTFLPKVSRETQKKELRELSMSWF